VQVVEESVCVHRGLGVQLSTRFRSGSTRHRFIDIASIEAVVLNEGIQLFTVLFYMAFIVCELPSPLLLAQHSTHTTDNHTAAEGAHRESAAEDVDAHHSGKVGTSSGGDHMVGESRASESEQQEGEHADEREREMEREREQTEEKQKKTLENTRRRKKNKPSLAASSLLSGVGSSGYDPSTLSAPGGSASTTPPRLVMAFEVRRVLSCLSFSADPLLSSVLCVVSC
jgi:GPI-GlcNAc transferase complex, PIG-H component